MPVGNDVVDLMHPGVQPGAQHPRFDARVFSDVERRALARSRAPLRLRWTAWAAKEAAYKVMKKLDADTVWAPRRFVFHRESRTRGRVEYQGRSLSLHIDANRERIHVVATGPVGADVVADAAQAQAHAHDAAQTQGALRSTDACAAHAHEADMAQTQGALQGAGAAQAQCALRSTDAVIAHAHGADADMAQSTRSVAAQAQGAVATHGAAVAQRGDMDPSEAVRRLALSTILPRLGIDADADTARIERRRRIPYLVHRGRPAAVDLSLSHHGRFVACAFHAARAPEVQAR